MSTSHIVSAPVVTPISSSQVNLSQELPEKYLSLHGYGDSTGWVPVRKIVCIVDAKLHAMGAFRPEDFTKDPRIVQASTTFVTPFGSLDISPRFVAN